MSPGPLIARIGRSPETGVGHVQFEAAPLRRSLPDGRVMVAIAGPAHVDLEAIERWMDRGCPDPAPMRQGFAAVLADPRSLEVTLVASARYEVALFWFRAGDELVISSHLRPLLDRVPELDLDDDAMRRYLTGGDSPANTMYAGIHRVPLGHLVTWRPGVEPWTRRWFHPDEVDPMKDANEGVARLRTAVFEAVSASLPPVGDIAAHLSGGLDSTSVAAAAARELHPQGRVVHAVSHLVSPWPAWLAPETDDGPPIEAFLRHVPGVTSTHLPFDERNPLDAHRELIEIAGAPFRNPLNAPWMRAIDSWLGARDLPVVVTGLHGSASYSISRQSQYRRAIASGQLPLVARDLAARRRSGDETTLLAHDVVADISPAAVRQWRRLRHRLAAPVAARRLPVGRRWFRASVLVDPFGGVPIQPVGVGAWVSDPLSDQEVTRTLFALPPDVWLGEGRDRDAARRAMSGILPDEVRLRSARGIQAVDIDRAVAQHQSAYREALDEVMGSPLARTYLDVASLAASMAEGVPADGGDAYAWQLTHGRVLGHGLYFVWLEQQQARRRHG